MEVRETFCALTLWGNSACDLTVGFAFQATAFPQGFVDQFAAVETLQPRSVWSCLADGPCLLCVLGTFRESTYSCGGQVPWGELLCIKAGIHPIPAQEGIVKMAISNRMTITLEPLPLVIRITCVTTMPRTLEWTNTKNFQGFGCSACNWKFKPSGALAGDSLDEMKKDYEARRDIEFAAHVCVKHPRSKVTRTR
jgi:hypothetical protein